MMDINRVTTITWSEINHRKLRTLLRKTNVSSVRSLSKVPQIKII
jgi:hypothetical protein